MKRNTIYLFAALLIMLSASSCKKDNAGSGLKAVFSYVADGYKVNFTNFSTGATEYSWDFGDGTGVGSTSKTPQHIFTKKGDFLVSLTAKNGAETSVFKDTVSIIGPNIKIDGDYSDWQYVPYTYQNDAAYVSSVRSVKAFASADAIYINLEGDANMKMEIIDIYMDADNNPATGFNTWYYPLHSGADFLLEGSPVGGWGDVFVHSGPQTAFSWTPVAAFADAMKFSALSTVGGKNVIEFSIKRSVLGTTRNFIHFGLVESNSGWAEVGQISEAKTATSKFIVVPL
ncbi:PKD domain-containing protein [Ferruginibacter sp.]|nr:PKD domain-containing protein [Ferruginibacter sp.]